MKMMTMILLVLFTLAVPVIADVREKSPNIPRRELWPTPRRITRPLVERKNTEKQKENPRQREYTNAPAFSRKKTFFFEVPTLPVERKKAPSILEKFDGEVAKKIPGTGMSENNFRYRITDHFSFEFNSRVGSSSSPREPEVRGGIRLRLNWSF